MVVRDELIQNLFLGDSVAVVGLYSTKHSGDSVYRILDVLSVTPITVPVPCLLPGSLRDICEARNRSPWQLLSLLAYCITPADTPQAGVALVGDVESFSKVDTESLSSALQNKAVIIGKRKHEIFPLKSSIWGYHREGGRRKNKAAMYYLSWDIVYNPVAEMPGEEDALLNSDQEDVVESLVPECDLASYLTIASTINVQFDEACTRLIEGFCVAAKSVRYGSGCELPVNASYTLHLLAGNHARINFRETVLDVDAVAALKLYDECLSSHQQYSTVDSPKTTHIKPG
eukprot:sb/3467734/